MATPELSAPLTEQPASGIEISKPLPQFGWFPKLPIELRLEIWNLTMLPRTVDIHIHQIGVLKSNDYQLAELYSKTPVPAALQVCRESRGEALQTYKLCFGTQMVAIEDKQGMFGFVRNARTYFSYKMDTVNFKYIGELARELPIAYMVEEDLENIRHIRADWCVHVNERLVKHIACFKKLESFNLSWFWQEKLSDGEYDNIALDEVEATEANYQLLHDRPDIHQFMDAFVTARDVFIPGYHIPVLRVRSMNNHQMMDNTRNADMVLGKSVDR
jgi:hypothetical protein